MEGAGAVGRDGGGEIPSPGTGGFGDLGLTGGSKRPEAHGLGGFWPNYSANHFEHMLRNFC